MSYYRFIRTNQEHRINEAHGLEGVRIRAKRGHKLLPNSYADLASTIQHSWKKHRLTQYRVAS